MMIYPTSLEVGMHEMLGRMPHGKDVESLVGSDGSRPEESLLRER
jgi:hypothetical protein